MVFGSSIEQRKIKDFLKKLLESFHLKHLIYKMMIVPSQEIALYRLRKIVWNFNSLNKKYKGKKILFNSVDAKYLRSTYFEGEIAKSLQARGHKVKMLICGGALNMCTTRFTIEKPPDSWSCKNCIYFSTNFFKTIGLPHSIYQDYIKGEELETIKSKVNEMSLEKCKNFIYKGVKVGFLSITSTQRYFKGGKPTKKSYEHVLRSELINAIISTDVAEKVLNKDKPDILITIHSGYSSWGSFAEYLRNNGVRVCVWGSGYTKDTVIFNRHDLHDNFKEYYEKNRKNKTLNEREEVELISFLDKRKQGEKEGGTYKYGFSQDGRNLERLYGVNKYKKTYVLFPNLPWDASLINANEAFKDVYEWISYTIELFKERKKLQLIIKIHPSEKISGSRRTVLDYIYDKFEFVPSNIKIIPPETKISAYSLFPFIDVGIVYIGTLGLEMTLDNIPVVIAGRIHYGNNGFTYNISTKREYRDTLFADTPKLKEQNIELAKTYAYFYFIKSFIPNNFIYYNNFLDLGWKINSLGEFAEGKDKFLDHICNYIINGGIYQDW